MIDVNDDHMPAATDEQVTLWANQAQASNTVAQFRIQALCQRIREDQQRIDDKQKRKNEAYTERNQVVAGLATACQALGFPVHRCLHPAEDADWDPLWRFIVEIELPTGQITWHYTEAHSHLFEKFPLREDHVWDGHTTPQKYQRLENWSPVNVGELISNISEDLRDIQCNSNGCGFAGQPRNLCVNCQTVSQLQTDLDKYREQFDG